MSENNGKPVPSEATEDPSRRKFLLTLGGLGALWCGAAAYPTYKYLAPQPVPDPFGKEGKAQVDKISPADVARPGMGKNGGYGGRGLIVVRKPDGTLKAFDAKCTHAGCNVAFEGDKLHCPCHGGIYDFDGKNISGPPPKPLTELKVFEENGLLYVARLEAPKKQG